MRGVRHQACTVCSTVSDCLTNRKPYHVRYSLAVRSQTAMESPPEMTEEDTIMFPEEVHPNPQPSTLDHGP
eukprot:3627360-Rhodomonas_salina.2